MKFKRRKPRKGRKWLQKTPHGYSSEGVIAKAKSLLGDVKKQKEEIVL